MNASAADAYLAKALEDLEEARQIAAIGLPKPAARAAYYAMFHAAQGLIIDRTGHLAKSHSGVRSEFARLTLTEASIDRSHTRSLAAAYKFKELGDYGVGPEGQVTVEAAADIIQTAGEFVACVAGLLGKPSD